MAGLVGAKLIAKGGQVLIESLGEAAEAAIRKIDEFYVDEFGGGGRFNFVEFKYLHKNMKLERFDAFSNDERMKILADRGFDMDIIRARLTEKNLRIRHSTGAYWED